MRSRNRILIAQTQRLSLNSSLSMAIEVLRADATSLTAFLEEKAAEIPALVVSAPVQREWRPRWSDAFSRPGLWLLQAQAIVKEKVEGADTHSLKATLVLQVP